MSERYLVILTCDISGCGSAITVCVDNADLARSHAAAHSRWSHRDGQDLCRSHTILNTQRGVKPGDGL